MSRFSNVWHWLSRLRWRRVREQEIDEELRFHIEAQIEQNLAAGMKHEEARALALRQFGNIALFKEGYRESRMSKLECMLETLVQDAHYGIRMLLKRPGFTIVAVLILALGLGANTAIFSIINAVLLRPLDFKDPERLVAVHETRPETGDTDLTCAAHEFVAWKNQNRVFEQLTAYEGAAFNLTDNGNPETVGALQVTADFFTVLGVSPALGRTFIPGEDQVKARIVILSDGLWKVRFYSDREIVGKTIRLNDLRYTVIGVMPPMELMPELWVPMNLPSELPKTEKHNYVAIARLRPGVSRDQAQADLARISKQIEVEFPDSYGHNVKVEAAHADLVENVRLALLVLFGAVGFVLLIACTNVANLLLTRAAARQKEIAIRAALGASRWRLIRQLLTESLLLAVMGGIVGLLLAIWMVDLLSKIKAVHVPRLEHISIDGQVLAVTIGLSLLTGLITGVMPALRSSKPGLIQWVKDGTRTSAGPARRRLGNLLVVIEVALALILLVGSGLMIKSFLRLLSVDPGFNPHNLLTVSISLPRPRYPQAHQQLDFFQSLFERVETLPGVRSVGATSILPTQGDMGFRLKIDGRSHPLGQEPGAALRVVSPDYFSTMGIPLRKGRYFSTTDARVAIPVIRWFPDQVNHPRYNESQPPPVAIINETMARLYWPNEDPLGRRVSFLFTPWLTIVGVVGDIRHNGLDSPLNPEMYMLHLQEPWNEMSVVVRTAGDPTMLTGPVREQVRALDKELPMAISTMDGIISVSVGRPRFYTIVLGLFGAVAMMLAVIGIFGVVSYSVTQRTHEIGVRMALGAQRSDVLKLVIRQGMVPIVFGVVFGLAGALALTRVMSKLLFEVSPTDPATFVYISLLLAGVALLASYGPARRATKVDPVVALRAE